jgi:hypothetical protein
LRHATSRWDPVTKSAYSAEEAELDGILGEDEEMFISEGKTLPREKTSPDIEISTPQVAEREGFPKMYADDDTVSTFNPLGMRNLVTTSTVFMPKVLNLDTHNAQPTTPAAIPANVNQVETDSKKKFQMQNLGYHP